MIGWEILLKSDPRRYLRFATTRMVNRLAILSTSSWKAHTITPNMGTMDLSSTITESPSHTPPSYAVSTHAISTHAAFSHTASSHTTSSYATSIYAALSYATSSQTTSIHAASSYTTSLHTTYTHAAFPGSISSHASFRKEKREAWQDWGPVREDSLDADVMKRPVFGIVVNPMSSPHVQL